MIVGLFCFQFANLDNEVCIFIVEFLLGELGISWGEGDVIGIIIDIDERVIISEYILKEEMELVILSCLHCLLCLKQ